MIINDVYLPYLDDKSRFLVLYGGGGCFSPDTLVNTCVGLKPIKDINESDFVLSFNHITSKYQYKQVVKKYTFTEVEIRHKVIKLHLKSGKEIECTLDHTFYDGIEYIPAFVLIRRAMEESGRDILCEQLREIINNQLEEHRTNKDNETREGWERIPKNNGSVEREESYDKNAPLYCQSPDSKYREQTGNQSQERRQNRQSNRESGMGNQKGEYPARQKEQLTESFERVGYRHIYSNGKSGFRNTFEIQETDLHTGNVSCGIRSKTNLHQRRYTPAILEAHLINSVSESSANTVYDLCVADNHNYCITENNYLVHNSGKSVFAAQKIIARVKTEKPHKFLVLRKVGATVKDSVFAELKSVIFRENMEKEFKINKSEYSITHLPTGNEILCKGLDEPEKIKSIQGITGIWAEEVTEFTEEDLDQLNIRIRGEKANYVQFIFSFNPISEDNHVVKRFVINKDPLATLVHTTYVNNHFLSQQDKDVLEGYKLTNKLFYDVYCLGLPGVVDKSNKFLYSFGDAQIKEGLTETNGLPLRLSFDFNIDPFTCYVYQRIDPKTVHIFDRFRLNDSDITQITDRIKAKYPGRILICTGDVTGKNRTGSVRGKRSYWQTIKDELNLMDSQFRLRPKNLDLISSRILCNSAIQHLNVFIDKELTELINDCKYAKVDDYGILIKDRDDNKCDDLDCFRYILDAEFPDIIVNPKKYK